MYQPELAPIADNLAASALVAILPLLAVFVLIGVVRMKAHWAGLIGVGVALAVAIFGYNMPAGMAVSSGLHGALFGIFPITWIVLTAIFYFELTVASGHHDDLMKTFNAISFDPRVLGLLIAFSFCSLLEALAGFGAPIAIVVAMLIALGFPPVKAAIIALVGNTMAVPFGAMATPVITGANLTGIDLGNMSFTVTMITGTLVGLVPFLMLAIMDGVKGLKEVWPLALVLGASFAALTIASAKFGAPGLVNMVAGLGSLAIGVGMLFIWKPKGAEAALQRVTGKDAAQLPKEKVTRSEVTWALFPYVLIIVVFGVTQLVTPVKNWLASTNILIEWPLLSNDGVAQVLNAHGEPSSSVVYNFQWLSSPGTILLITGIAVGLIYGMGMKKTLGVFGQQLYKLRWTFVTIGAVLALAYIMNISGQTLTIGTFIAGAGKIFPFLAPLLGWIGGAVTGSGTSTTALFSNLQQAAANQIGVNENLLVAANTAGGAAGKMISPQNLAIAAGAMPESGKEPEILRKAAPWSALFIVAMCLLVGLQATGPLTWMIPA
ncbi:L-lactate permease [Trueperella bialowiezensis]|uniref:L-lactate permease n=1 Tax=Trueperella bialowiezensis TaxID=312285 RepID=A0A448PCT3_9ACTO|nr:L-lactate permease [Trueperella bialowiezensis]VEI12734.1 Glycolate permease glcA [Trueperella bialowiezensis]